MTGNFPDIPPFLSNSSATGVIPQATAAQSTPVARAPRSQDPPPAEPQGYRAQLPGPSISYLPPPPTQPEAPLALQNAGLLAIPPPLVKRVREGAFIDLGDLLPEALEWAFERSYPEAPEREKRKRFAITSVADWALAFATYMAIRVQSSPHLAIPLATYQVIITRLARDIPGTTWQRYDRMFRQTAATNPGLRWDLRQPDVWLAALASCQQPATAPTPQPAWPQATHRPPPPRPSASGEICRKFSKGECERLNGNCRYRHACAICGCRTHSARDCPTLAPPARRPPPPHPF